MNLNKVKFWNDVLMFLDFLLLAGSGFVLKFILPRGAGRLGDNFILLREEWLAIHNWTSVVLIVLLLIHLILNFNWIVAMLKSVFTRQN